MSWGRGQRGLSAAVAGHGRDDERAMGHLWGRGGGRRAELHGIRRGVVGECASRKALRLVFAAALAARTAGRPGSGDRTGQRIRPESCTLPGDRRRTRAALSTLVRCWPFICVYLQSNAVAPVRACTSERRYFYAGVCVFHSSWSSSTSSPWGNGEGAMHLPGIISHCICYARQTWPMWAWPPTFLAMTHFGSACA